MVQGAPPPVSPSDGQELLARCKVVRIITRLNVGGPAIHTILLTALLDPRRYESVLVTGSEGATEGSMRYLAEERQVALNTIPEIGREISWIDDLVALIKLVRILRREKPDIVHTHTAKAGTLGRIAALIALAGTRKAVFHTFHGHVFHGYFSPLKTRFFITIERILGIFTDRLIAVSEETRADLIKYRVAAPSKIDCIPLGLDLERFANCEKHEGALRRELQIPGGARIVGIVARLVPIKAIDLFLRAASIVGNKLPGVHFVIVGDGELRESLEKLARTLGLAGSVHFLGFRNDLDRIYADLDIVVLSSFNEGLPVSLIEAMSSARVVLSTAVGGVPNLVSDGDTGFLVPSGSEEALANGILRALQNYDQLGSMRRKAREYALAEFDIARLVRDIDDLYSSAKRQTS